MKRRYSEKKTNETHYVAVQFDGLLPIVVSAAFQPEEDFFGNEIQDLGLLNNNLQHLAMTVTSFSGKSVIVFCWLGERLGPVLSFVESFLKIPPGEMADRIVTLAFAASENIFLDPNWWESLDNSNRARLNKLILNGVMDKDADVLSSTHSASSVPVKSVIKSW